MAKVYSSERVKLTLAGQLVLTGWDTISISRNAENKALQVAADGIVAKSTNADRTGSMTIAVQQQNNDFAFQMAAIQNVIDANPDKEIDLSLTLTDPSGGNNTVLEGVELQKMPDQNFGGEAESREYMFSINKVSYVPAPEGFDKANKAVSTALELRSQITQALLA